MADLCSCLKERGLRPMDIMLKPIGIIHSPFQTTQDIDPMKYADSRGFDSIRGDIEIFEEYAEGLEDTEGFSHLIVIFAFHLSEGYRLHTKPLLDDVLRGVFSTRSPHRPNPIGLTIVRVLERRGRVIRVAGVDMIEGTPVLDIKPYTPRDRKTGIRIGWLTGKIDGLTADD